MKEDGVLSNGRIPRSDSVSAVVLGVLSLLFFWIPLLAPLIQLAALIQSVRCARRRLAPAWSLAIGFGGAVVGLGLFLAVEHVWLV